MAIEASNAQSEQAMPELIPCLREAGMDIPDDVAVGELQDLILAYWSTPYPAPGDPGVTEDGDGGYPYEHELPGEYAASVGCLDAAGISGY